MIKFGTMKGTIVCCSTNRAFDRLFPLLAAGTALSRSYSSTDGIQSMIKPKSKLLLLCLYFAIHIYKCLLAMGYSFFAGCGDNCSVMFLGSFHARAINLVWLPRANTSSLLFLNWIDVKAIVLPTKLYISLVHVVIPRKIHTYHKTPPLW